MEVATPPRVSPGRAALVLLAVLLALGRAGADPLTRTVPAGGTAVVALPAEIETMDPARATGRSTWRALSCVYETLVRPGEKPGDVLPGLAVAWEPEAGGRAWTFHLRRDVYFHDGRPLTATAAVLSLRRQFDPLITPSTSDRSRFVFWRSLLGGPPSVVRSVVPVDSHTLRLELRRPVADLLEILAYPPAAIVAPAAATAQGGFPPVGTGPFRFVEWRAGQRLTLESNLHYWGGRPPLDYLVFTVVPGASARSRELVRGNADLAAALDLRQVDTLKAGPPALDMVASAGHDGTVLAMNCSRPPWSDIRARLALQHALPRGELARRFFGRRGVPAVGVLSPRCWADDPTLRAYSFDPARARRLMDRVKRPPDFKPDLLYPRTSPVLADPQEFALQVSRRLAAAGLSVVPRAVDPEELALRLQRGSYDLALVGEERGLADPDVALYPAWSRDNARTWGTNWSYFRSGRLTDLLEMARSTPEREHRRQAYREAQQQLHQAAPAVPLAWSLEVLGRQRGFSGVTMNRLGILDFSRAWLGHR